MKTKILEFVKPDKLIIYSKIKFLISISENILIFYSCCK